MKIKFWVLILYIISSLPFYASDFKPILTNFSPSQYKAALQNWAIAEGDNGEIFIGNEEGVLTYDGYWWNKYPLPGRAIARSLLYADQRLYVGSYEDFGYMKADEKGVFQYTSLWKQLKGYKPHNDEIWNIIKTKDNKIVFQSFCSWFEYDGKKVTAHYNPNLFPLYCFSLFNRMYIQVVNGGFGYMEGKDYKEIISKTQLQGSAIVSAMEYGHKNLLLATDKQGLKVYDGQTIKPFTTDIDALLPKAQINRALLLPSDSSIILGTIHDGIYALSNKGRVKWHYNMKNQLSSNTVLRLMTDRNHNIWVALDASIALIHTSTPYRLMTDSNAPLGMVYDVFASSQGLYVATNQGTWLYHQGGKQLVSGTEGQNWHLTSFDNRLIVGNNQGTKIITGTQSALVPGSSLASSTALRRHIINEQNNYLIESSYADLRVYQNIQGRWVFQHNINNFQAPIQQLELEHNGVLWAAHMSKGIYRLELSGDMKKITQKQYFPSLSAAQHGSFIHVAKIRGEIVFGEGQHIYRYVSKKFVRFTELEQILKAALISVTPIDNERFWVSTDKGYSLIKFKNRRYIQECYVPFALFGLDNGNRTNHIKVKNDTSYFCLNGGIGLVNIKDLAHHYAAQKAYKLRLSSAHYISPDQQKHTLPLSGEKIKVFGTTILRYSYPNFNHKPLQFHFTIKAGRKENKVQSSQPELVLNNLEYGDYEVLAEVKDINGKTISSTTYSFQYPPPFLLSFPMVLCYLLLGGVLVWLAIRWQTNKALKQQQQAMEAEQMRQQLKLAKQQRIIETQKQQLLEQQIEEQSKDIAALSINAVKSQNSQEDEQYWKMFQDNFDLIHKQCFRHLREKYPSLTSTDLKFCALLRLNLSTKDIARFTGLIIRGVEGARLRLRKKLQLPENKSLTDFLIDFK